MNESGRERLGLMPSNYAGISYSGNRDGLVMVRNTTASTVQQYGILQLDGPIVEPDDDFPETYEPVTLFNGITPITDYDDPKAGFGLFCVATHPILANSNGLAVMSGLTHVKLNCDNGLWDWADIGSSSTQLYAQPCGSAAVVWRADEAGEDGLFNAIVMLSPMGNNGTVTGVANGAVAKDAVGQCTPDKPVGTVDYPTEDVPFLNTLAAIEDGSFIVIGWERERRRLVLYDATCSA
jgi:hypothetical protein